MSAAPALKLAAPAHKRPIYAEGEEPLLATLEWKSSLDRAKARSAWRRAIADTFRDEPRQIAVAWALSDFMNLETCRATLTNETLASEVGLPVKRVEDALKRLEDKGAIVRNLVRVPDRKRAQRRIYLGNKLLSEDACDCPPVTRGESPPFTKGAHARGAPLLAP